MRRLKNLWKSIISICLAGVLVFACVPMTSVNAENNGSKSEGTYFNRTDKNDIDLLEKTATLIKGSDNDYEIALKLRPPKTLYLPSQKTTDIVLIIDSSGSMGDGLGIGYNNIMTTVKSAAQTLVKKILSNEHLKGKVRFSVVSFSSYAQDVCDWSRNAYEINRGIKSIVAKGGTNTEAGFEMARQKLAESSADKKYAILFSDGQPTYRTSILSTDISPSYFDNFLNFNNFLYSDNYDDLYNHYCEDDYSYPDSNYYLTYVYKQRNTRYHSKPLLVTEEYLRTNDCRFGNGRNDKYKFNEECALAHAEMLKQPKGTAVEKNIYLKNNKVGVVKGNGVGATLITVGYKNNEDSGSAFLKEAATSPDCYFNAEDPLAIYKVFADITNIITQKAFNAVVIDKVDSRFEILKNHSCQVTVGGKKQNVKVSFDGQDVIAKLGNIESIDENRPENDKDIIIKFRIHLKDESFPKEGSYNGIYTNESASVTYRQGDETKKQIFEKPKVNIKRQKDILGSSKSVHLTNWEKREYQITLNCWTQKDKLEDKSQPKVEGVQVTDVLDPRFELTEKARADLLAEGTSITDNKDGTTTLVWNNLKVGIKDTPSAFLRKIMVKAKPNFIGGNNIPTNVAAKSGIKIGKSAFTAFSSHPYVNVRLTMPVNNKKETIWIGHTIPVTGVETEMAPYILQQGFSHKWFQDSSCTKPITLQDIGNKKPEDTVKHYLQVSYEKAGNTTNESNQNSTLNGKIYSVLPQDCKAVGVYTIDVKSASLQINKTLTEPIPSDDKAQYPFVFKIERRDTPKGPVQDTFYQTIIFNKNDSLKKTAKVVQMKKGYYTVTEEQSDAWRYEPIVAKNSIIQEITVTKPVQYEVSYTNKRVNSQWLGDTAVVINTEQK